MEELQNGDNFALVVEKDDTLAHVEELLGGVARDGDILRSLSFE